MARILRGAAATAVLVTTARLARSGVPEWERSVNDGINDLPDALAPYVWPPMQFGAFLSPIVIGGVTYWHTRRADPAVPIAAAGLTAWLTAKAIKQIVGRGRPFDFDPHTRLRLGTEIDGSLGFVSGHAAVATAIAGISSPYLPSPTAAAVYGLAGLVGLSRVYVGAHLPVDVVGGMALGQLVADGVAALPLAGILDRTR